MQDQVNIDALRESISKHDLYKFVQHIRDYIKLDPSILEYDVPTLVHCALFKFEALNHQELFDLIVNHFERMFCKTVYLDLSDAEIASKIQQAQREKLEYITQCPGLK